jgi:HEAT repeat protein
MELAVREEDYATAAEAKAEVDMLRERLPSDKMLLASLLDKLETRLPVSDKERMTAIRQLGDLGDMAAAPALAGCLHDGEPAVAEAAENALWAVFMRCVAAAVGLAGKAVI